MDDLLGEIHERAKKNERVLVTTLTKKMAEDLTEFLKEMGVRVRYLHSDIVTIERAEIIRDLRAGVFDVLVGINLLREGLDMPEVSLVAILDADKEGFLRSDTAMIQTIGRAARNEHGHVIMYADRITGSMQRAMDETERRREVQQAYNTERNITPTTIKKDVKDLIELTKLDDDGTDMIDQLSDDTMADAYGSGESSATRSKSGGRGRKTASKSGASGASASGSTNGRGSSNGGTRGAKEVLVYDQVAESAYVAELTPEELYNKIEKMDRDMKAAAKQLDFELAAELRDTLGELRQQWADMHSAKDGKLVKPKSTTRKRTTPKK